MALEKIPIGVPTGDVEFVPRIPLFGSAARFEVELAGDVVRVGRDHLLRLIPAAVLERAPGDGRRQRVDVQICERRRHAGRRALRELFAAMRRRKPRRWSVIVRAPGTTYDDVFELARSPRKAIARPVAVKLRLAVYLRGKRKPVTTRSFRGLMAVSTSERDPSGEPGPEGSFLFACHAHWYGYPGGGWTLCHGPCTSGSCVTVWNNRQWDDGWCFGTCD